MNRWECSYPGCKSVAEGSGSEFGLQEIGWSVKSRTITWDEDTYFPVLLCPIHHPERTKSEDRHHPNPRMRVIRILEYEGPAAWVRDQECNVNRLPDGSNHLGIRNGIECVIRSTTLPRVEVNNPTQEDDHG